RQRVEAVCAMVETEERIRGIEKAGFPAYIESPGLPGDEDWSMIWRERRCTQVDLQGQRT
ncbi:MAG: hypothetical protein QNM00_03715, partial [Gammaproteobacteria bacterium]|nr:hypothetical protein [Gammaproteobacteria bacterium]